LENVAHAIVALKPRSVLDFGCGDGRLLKELLVRLPDDVRLVGQDLDRRALMYARAFHDGTSVRFVPSLDDVAGERFDVIVTSEVLEHIPPDECRGVVEKLWERVAPSGSLVVTVPTTNLPLSRKHYRHFDLELLRAVVEPGFELRSVRYLHRAGAIHKLVRGLASNRLFLATWRPYLRGLQYAFRRWVEPAAASDGTRLLTVWARAQAQDWD
jgi:cyclopropane fatty-acyl-phospholipid synthase-like methyltransferase